MDRSAVLRKTAKGQEEFATRAYRLPARLRSVLILVDGRLTAAEIVDRARHFGDAEQFLTSLVEEGFVESAPSAPPPAQSAAPVAASAPLVAVRRAAVAFLHEKFGPDADAMAVKIEEARDAATLRKQLERLRDLVKEVRGGRSAEEFWEKTGALLS